MVHVEIEHGKLAVGLRLKCNMDVSPRHQQVLSEGSVTWQDCEMFVIMESETTGAI